MVEAVQRSNEAAVLGPFASLRDYMRALEAGGHVLHIDAVDQDAYEATGIMYRLIDEYGWTGAPAVIFDRVKIDGRWVDGPVIANQYGKWQYEAMAFGIEPEGSQGDMYRAAVQKLSALVGGNGQWRTIEPVEINSANAPCKEVLLSGDQIDIRNYPFMQSNPADGGRYVNTGNVVMQDPEHGRNVGTYRCQIKGPRKIGVNPERKQHGWTFLMDKKARGDKFAPAAIVLGTDPIVFAMSSSKTARLGQDELAVAGGFLGRAVEVVKCETSDIMVPANAEMVIEGEIPFDLEPEGPFGEMYGYMGRYKSENFYMNIKAVTHRRDPIFVNQFTGVTRGYLTSPSEAGANLAFKRLVPNLVGLHLPAAMTGFCFVSIDKQAPGQGLEAGRQISKVLGIAKIVVVVDKEVDIHNSGEVLHAIGARWQPHPSTEIVAEGVGMPLDPSVSKRGFSSKAIIDATRQRPDEGGPNDYARMNRECLIEAFPDIFARVDARWWELLKR